MLFNSFQFIWLFPIIFIGYYLICSFTKCSYSRWDNYTLLLISYLLYAQWKPVFVIVLLWVTLITYIGGRLLINVKYKWILSACLCLAVAPLIFFKYYGFINETICSLVGYSISLKGLNWAIPIGLSFYTFQAIGYVVDVHYKRVEPEKNWWDYMLFVSFFPQILSGPISKATDLLPQIKSRRVFNDKIASEGLKLLLWGCFLKVVMADQLGQYVDTIYGAYSLQSGATCAIGAICYSFQIYGDFAGYSLMAVGTGKIMGFDLINNFNRPYFAPTITEFWKRWHISLTQWLTKCIYIPLGGSRCSKIRSYLNIMITFLVSGLWHGANWTFVIWGAIHGALQIIEKYMGIQKFVSSNRFMYLLRVGFTFSLVTLAWVFFRMPTLTDALGFIRQICINHDMSVLNPGNSISFFCLSSLMLVILVELKQEFMAGKFMFIHGDSMIVRWLSYLFLTVFILLAGIFDSSNFIYVSF